MFNETLIYSAIFGSNIHFSRFIIMACAFLAMVWLLWVTVLVFKSSYVSNQQKFCMLVIFQVLLGFLFYLDDPIRIGNMLMVTLVMFWVASFTINLIILVFAAALVLSFSAMPPYGSTLVPGLLGLGVFLVNCFVLQLKMLPVYNEKKEGGYVTQEPNKHGVESNYRDCMASSALSLMIFGLFLMMTPAQLWAVMLAHAYHFAGNIQWKLFTVSIPLTFAGYCYVRWDRYKDWRIDKLYQSGPQKDGPLEVHDPAA